MLVLILALALDLAVGEPPAAVHPVIWIGKAIALMESRAPREGRMLQLVYGGAGTAAIVILVALLVSIALGWLRALSWPLCLLASAFLLKCTFSLRELRRAAMRVKRALLEGKLSDARFELRSLVSRDTSQLDDPLVVAAAVESVAENTSDSFVAPLLFYLLLGVPGALAYRAANTFDSMLGYHGRYEYLGKVPARLDDLLNLVPARLTGLLTVAAAGLAGFPAGASWRVMARDHGLTESPNAGWSMSAAAGALSVRLEKVGHYRLGNSVSPLLPETIEQAVKLLYGVASLAVLLYLAVQGIRYVYSS